MVTSPKVVACITTILKKKWCKSHHTRGRPRIACKKNCLRYSHIIPTLSLYQPYKNDVCDKHNPQQDPSRPIPHLSHQT